MVIKKKVKISNVKRGQHLKQKKNYSKPLKKKELPATTSKQNKNNPQKIFGKPTNTSGKQKRNNANRPKSLATFPPKNNQNVDEDDDVIYDQIADMIGDDDVDDLGTYDSSQRTKGKKRKRAETDENDEMSKNANSLEKEHARSRQQNLLGKKRQIDLLPIKSKSGEIITRTTEIEFDDAVEDEIDDSNGIDGDAEDMEEVIDSDDDVIKDNEASGSNVQNLENKAISTADLLILREQEIAKQKFRIGIICSGILEKPEDKMKNFAPLFELMDERNGEKTNLISVRKIAALSLLEVFKDVLPEYRIGQIDLKTQKVKKNTIERVTYENSLLQQYKKFLQKLEKLSAILTKKYSGSNYSRSIEHLKLADVAITCLCELLVAHSYFNFGTNIAQLLVYNLNANRPTVREKILHCFQSIFKEDKRLDLSLFIVRRINHLIKSKSNIVHVEVLSCLLSLPIKSINLDAEKEAELKQKKLEAKKARLMNMSKKEKKRQKRLQQLDKEMQETKAEENKQTKQYKLTEITKMIFTIYFRILKNDPSSTLLSTTLEGLAKFAHVINFDFFSDLVEVLNNIMETADLGYREQMHCIHTIFTILSGQGEVLNIDPLRFYGHLYRNLLIINAGKNHSDLLIILRTLHEVLVKRRKNITYHRLLAFIKRITTLSMHVMHNGTLACLGLVKTVMQLTSSTDILLDTDGTVGSGRYDAELDDPEFCNANCTALYEVCALSRHYHPTVRKIANHLAVGVPAIGEGSLSSDIGKLSPIELYENYDGSEMAFNPAIPPPRAIQFKEIKGQHHYLDNSLENYCKESLKCDLSTRRNNSLLDFSSDLR